MNTAFWILSGVTVLGAVLAVTLRSLVRCVLSLVLFFLGIAGHYFLLRADFIGAAQILIYIGAVAVLILFTIMLTRNVTGLEIPREVLGGTWWAGVATAGILGWLIWVAILGDRIAATLSPSGQMPAPVAGIGRALVTDWVVVLEVLGVLLTAALIGAVVIALEEKMEKS